MTRIRITFDDQDIECPGTASVAAALTDAGHRAFRRTETEGSRGLFCGIGVCQDCLVTIDGRPNQRACMTRARDGMAVRTQDPRPPLTQPPAQGRDARKLSPDVLVIGGGAGGLSAAIAAREAGATVVLLDERKVPGGQYFKQPADPEKPSLDPQQAQGAALVKAARNADVTVLGEVEVWGAFDGPEILASAPDAVYAIQPGALVVATGAYERPLMIPGWTLPGVITVGAAQTLWRSYGTLPGKRVALLGNGPLVAQVALELAEGGAEVACLAEAAPAPWRRPGAAIDMARRDLGLSGKGITMLAQLRRHSITPSYDSIPVRIEEAPDGLRITLQDGAVIEADAVCLNYGFQPQNEILRLLGVEMAYDDRFDQLRVSRDATCQTSVPRVFAVGDCCGLGGAPAAAVEGRIAGRAAAGGGKATTSELAELKRHRAFQSALWRLYDTTLPRAEDAPPETILCRCEEITRRDLDAALSDDPLDIGALKRATRLGMGRCQGRYCGPVAASAMARRTGRPLGDLSFFAPRIPVKPVDIAAITAAEALLDDNADDG